jgi:hypothetical protein
MGAARFVRRVLVGARNRRSLGRVQITFYPPASHASLVVSPALNTLRWGEWQWLYLQHLAECLATIANEREARRLLVAARTLAEDFVSTAEWPRPFNERVAGSIAGVADIVPKQPGGTTLAINVARQGREMPRVQLEWTLPQARERLASSNLVLQVHVMRSATHPLERYEFCKKIGLFTEFCQRAGRRLDRETLVTAPIFALVHADIADIARSVGGRPDESPTLALETPSATSLPPHPVPARRPPWGLPVLSHLRRVRWDHPGFTIAAAACLWAGLILSVVYLARYGATPLSQSPGVSQPVTSPPVTSPASPPLPLPNMRLDERAARAAPAGPPPASRASTPSRAPAAAPAVRATPPRRTTVASPAPPAERTPTAPPPRFRVVSGMLAREVAELRSQSLADEGVDAFVHASTGNVAQLQYGAYRSREIAETDAQRIRAQGYTAVVVRW